MKRYLIAAAATLLAASAFAQTEPFGSFKRPFTADSPWNIKPVGPVFGAFVIPTEASKFYGSVEGGKWSTAAFLAKADDPPMVVTLVKSGSGATDPDAQESPTSVTIPRWPAATTASGSSDGHAEVVDPVTGKIHSFWQLRLVNGKWVAAMHAWSELGGRGWGDPSHLRQGARATGVSTIGGLIRAHEVNDGQSVYQHALAMSLSLSSLAANPPYVYPATSADYNAAFDNKGQIPEGALMMLPPDFVLVNANPTLQKVVDTLKTYGARVVDRNTSTPFVIYVENGASWPLYSGNTGPVYSEMERIRASLRQVISASSYVDGNGNPTTTNVPGNFNFLSMRGPWIINWPTGATPARFNTFTQSVEFPSSPTQIEQSNGNGTGIAGGDPNPLTNGTGVSWGRPEAGATYKVTAIGTGGARLKVRIYKGGAVFSETGYLANGQSATVTWPTSGGWTTIYAQSAPNQAGSIRGTMLKQ